MAFKDQGELRGELTEKGCQELGEGANMAKCGDKLISYQKCTWTSGGSKVSMYILYRHLGIEGLLQVNHLAYAQSWTLLYSIYICMYSSFNHYS